MPNQVHRGRPPPLKPATRNTSRSGQAASPQVLVGHQTPRNMPTPTTWSDQRSTPHPQKYHIASPQQAASQQQGPSPVHSKPGSIPPHVRPWQPQGLNSRVVAHGHKLQYLIIVSGDGGPTTKDTAQHSTRLLGKRNTEVGEEYLRGKLGNVR